MKKTILVILSILMLIISLFALTGCKNNSEDIQKEGIENNIDNEIKTTVSCYKEGYLFKSKKSVKHVFYLNKDNRLIKYEHIEKYFDFTDDNDYKMISEGVDAEAELNNNTYKYRVQTPVVKTDPKEVTITDVYDISKMDSKNLFPNQEIEDNLSDDFIFNLENYKKIMTDKQYTFEEK